jgi:phosphoglycerate dehydrogenase-like enzyme
MTPVVVVIGEDIGSANLDWLRRQFTQVAFRFCPDEAKFTAASATAHILFSKNFPPAALAAAERLRWVQAGTAGVELLLAAGLVERGVPLTNASGAHGVPMAELILSMMLAFATGLHTLIRAQEACQWIQEQIIQYNVGRGASLEPAALFQALDEGWIAGAGLDVTSPEPPPPDSPLWAMPNVILSQHTSGSGPFNADRITRIFAANLARLLAGEPLLQVVDPGRGY